MLNWNTDINSNVIDVNRSNNKSNVKNLNLIRFYVSKVCALVNGGGEHQYIPLCQMSFDTRKRVMKKILGNKYNMNVMLRERVQ